MKMERQYVSLIALLVLSCVVFLNCTVAQAQKSKYACDEANPASMCTAANTCGSASAPCTVDITSPLYS